jgi:hypothetical protein
MNILASRIDNPKSETYDTDDLTDITLFVDIMRIRPFRSDAAFVGQRVPLLSAISDVPIDRDRCRSST